MDRELDAGPLDFESRRLCADGACTGVLGEDGRCRICGRDAELAAPSDDFLADGTKRVASVPNRDEPSAFDDSSDRRLCPDGACVGLIGADGRCKVCGAADRA
jgi:hypothetical protein